jgi:hypothetical protein
LLSLGDFRAPTFSLSVTRDDVGLEDEFELFMQLLGTYFNWLRCLCWNEYWISASPLLPYSRTRAKALLRLQTLLYSMSICEYRTVVTRAFRIPFIAAIYGAAGAMLDLS